MLTETEAKTKWCPFARYTSSRGQGINRWAMADDYNLSPGPAKCLGSACMAWRWKEDEGFKRAADAEYRKTGKRLENDCGYCGLAGNT